MSGRKSKEARKRVYGDSDPTDRKYRLTSDRFGNIVGRFVTVDGKRRLAVPTIAADYQRQAYQRAKQGRP